jgi:hypothetical protein
VSRSALGKTGRYHHGAQFQKFLKPVELGAAVFRHLGPGVGAADEGTQSNQKDIVKQVPGVVTSGVLEAIEMFAEG